MVTAAQIQILAALANRYSATAKELAEKLNIGKNTVLKTLRHLADRGFVFCDDDFEGRRRAGGKYANALWCMNCEISGLTLEQAEQALNTEGHGGDILCHMGVAC